MIDEYMRAGYWLPTTTADFWDRNAQEYPDDEAIVDSTQRLTWAEAKEQTDRIALGLLDLGLKRDEVIVLQLPASVDHALMRIACEKAGFVCVPAMRGFRHKDMEYILKFTNAVAFVIRSQFANFDYFQMTQEIRPNLPALKHILVVDDDVPPGTISVRAMTRQRLEEKYPPDYLQRTKLPATEFSVITHTGGTTGFPKLLEHPICVSLALGRIWADVMGITKDDIIGAFSPVARGPNCAPYYSGPVRAAKCVCLERFAAEDALKLIEKERITIAGYTTSQIRLMMTVPDFDRYDLSSLRFINAGGEPVPYHVALEAEEKFKCCVLQIFGNTEVGAFGLADADAPHEIRQTTFKARDGARVKFIDENGDEVPRGEVGELCVSGPTRQHLPAAISWIRKPPGVITPGMAGLALATWPRLMTMAIL
jgi:non-ribosomal peptide synthetase component E (peptide arylation enzyme)